MRLFVNDALMKKRSNVAVGESQMNPTSSFSSFKKGFLEKSIAFNINTRELRWLCCSKRILRNPYISRKYLLRHDAV